MKTAELTTDAPVTFTAAESEAPFKGLISRQLVLEVEPKQAVEPATGPAFWINQLEPSLVARVRRMETDEDAPVLGSLIESVLEAAGILRTLVGERPFITSDDDGRLSIEMQVSATAKLYVFVSADGTIEVIAYTDTSGTKRLPVSHLSELAPEVTKLAEQDT